MELGERGGVAILLEGVLSEIGCLKVWEDPFRSMQPSPLPRPGKTPPKNNNGWMNRPGCLRIQLPKPFFCTFWEGHFVAN